MSLPTYADLESYLRIETAGDRTLTTALVARATACVEQYLARPIEAEARTFTLEQPIDALYRSVTRLFVPVFPVAAQASSVDAPTVTDSDALELIEGDDYRLDYRTGIIYAAAGVAFAAWPYTIVATVGLDAHPHYAAKYEPILTQAIVDLAASWYQERNANATSESAGGGVSISYQLSEIPKRISAMLEPLVLRRVG
jgi:hypothetical protein